METLNTYPWDRKLIEMRVVKTTQFSNLIGWEMTFKRYDKANGEPTMKSSGILGFLDKPNHLSENTNSNASVSMNGSFCATA